MKPYFYKGEISPGLREHIIGNAEHFQAVMRASVEAFGGRVLRCHLLACSSEPAGFLEFPSDLSARAWNTFYGSQDGVLSSRIERLLDEADLTAMHKQIGESRAAATGHRGKP